MGGTARKKCNRCGWTGVGGFEPHRLDKCPKKDEPYLGFDYVYFNPARHKERTVWEFKGPTKGGLQALNSAKVAAKQANYSQSRLHYARLTKR